MFVKYLFWLLCLSAGSYGYAVSSESSIAGNGWEHVFARHPSSVIPLSHYGQKSYFLAVHAKATYMQAMQFCENIHMKLLSIRSPEENEKIHNIIRNTNSGRNYWTSASKLLDGKNWIWMSYGVSVEYTNWAPNLLYDDKALCLQLESNDESVYWKHTHCGNAMNFICERYESSETNSITTENQNASAQITRWMNLLDHVSPNIGLLEFGNKKYYFSSNFKANYMQAIQFCKIIKMELVSITSKEENERIRKYIRDTSGADYWWTSGSKLLDGKTWVWMTRGKRVEYTNWLLGQPDGDMQYCLQLMHRRDEGLFWNDQYCNDQYHVICERSSSDSIEEDGGNVATNRVTSTTPLIDIRIGSDVDDDNWNHIIRKTEPGFITYSYVEGKKYHLEVDHVATNSQAAQFCDYHKMQLVSIYDRKKSESIRHLLSDSPVSGPFWISGKKRAGTWVWSTSGEEVSFVNWSKNRPSDGSSDKDCIEIDDIAKWSDQRCLEKRYFICEDNGSLPSHSTLSPSSSRQCSAATPPVVKIYISNNVITEDGSTTVAERFLSSEDVQVSSDGGYHVQVKNNIASSVPEKDVRRNVSPYNPFYIHPDQDI